MQTFILRKLMSDRRPLVTFAERKCGGVGFCCQSADIVECNVRASENVILLSGSHFHLMDRRIWCVWLGIKYWDAYCSGLKGGILNWFVVCSMELVYFFIFCGF